MRCYVERCIYNKDFECTNTCEICIDSEGRCDEICIACEDDLKELRKRLSSGKE